MRVPYARPLCALAGGAGGGFPKPAGGCSTQPGRAIETACGPAGKAPALGAGPGEFDPRARDHHGRLVQRQDGGLTNRESRVQLPGRLPFATFVYRLGSSPFKRGKRDRHPQVAPSMPAPADPASGLRNRHAEVRLFPWAPFKAAPLGRSRAFEAWQREFDSRRGRHDQGFEAQREEHPVPSRADAGSSPAGTTIAGSDRRHAASGRHAMTPAVRARISGGARHETSASWKGAPG